MIKLGFHFPGNNEINAPVIPAKAGTHVRHLLTRNNNADPGLRRDDIVIVARFPLAPAVTRV
jgi:hypothetical protein